MINKSILITCFDRPDSLKKCINHLYLANNINKYNVVFVRQKGNSKVQKIVENSRFEKKFIITTKYPKKFSPLKKMANNGFKGWKYCFENLKSDYAIYLEDDILISYDFLDFHDFVHQKYKNDNKFFGVNGFSGEIYNFKKISKYSKFVYGLGKGFSTNKLNWKLFRSKIWNKNFLQKVNPALDSANENFVKKNNLYVVMPICSRILEDYTNGLHIKKTNKSYFKKLRRSFVKIKYKKKLYDYSFFESYNWRNDCRKYRGLLFEKLYKFLKYTRKNYL